MNQEEINIFHMQCWLFRMAQVQWNLTPIETAEIFKQYDLFGYIADCYVILHLSSYQYALLELESFLSEKCATLPSPGN